MKRLSNTEAELKKTSVAYKDEACIGFEQVNAAWATGRLHFRTLTANLKTNCCLNSVDICSLGMDNF